MTKPFIALLIFVGIISCTKDNDYGNYAVLTTVKTNPGETTNQRFLKSEVRATKEVDNRQKTMLLINCYKSNGEGLNLVVESPRVGNFDLFYTQQQVIFIRTAGILFSGTNYRSTSGVITISKLTDSTVKGSFNATCSFINDTTISLYNGKFDCRLN